MSWFAAVAAAPCFSLGIEEGTLSRDPEGEIPPQTDRLRLWGVLAGLQVSAFSIVACGGNSESRKLKLLVLQRPARQIPQLSICHGW